MVPFGKYGSVGKGIASVLPQNKSEKTGKSKSRKWSNRLE